MSIINWGIKKIIGIKNIRKLKYQISFRYNKKFINLKRKPKTLISLIPIHGNLGDHAIAYAYIKFLAEKFLKYVINTYLRIKG